MAPAARRSPLERSAAFLVAGADGVFVPGAVDPGTVKTLAEGIEGPLNVMVGRGAPTVAELAALGLARVSADSGIARAAHALVRRAAGSCWSRRRTHTARRPRPRGTQWATGSRPSGLPRGAAL
ncbi:isocitrate lyase/phosphoenolpyruvate mutase family protein [Streptomyces sp. NPDC001848]|uniref:isocitrate lyase/phosphoenolpyruvate mutase family protein n=1 Tax=Streptomyces sp. NPDC001848 TaxID=3364618 RepID=UPI0036826AA8